MYETNQTISSTKRPHMPISNNFSSYKSTSSGSGGSVPITPHLYSSMQAAHRRHDSDSSDENLWSKQRMGLRITNPDTENDVNTSNKDMAHLSPSVTIEHTRKNANVIHDIQEKQQIESRISPTVVPMPGTPIVNQNETQTFAFGNMEKPVLPLHQQQSTLNITYSDPCAVRRESRAFAYENGTLHTNSSVYEQDHNKKQQLAQPLEHETANPESLSSVTYSPNDSYSVPGSLRSMPHITSSQLALEEANKKVSKYAKVSYHLTNDPNAIKRYREMAEKTNDTTTQLMFAKYLLETANAFYASSDPNKPPNIVGSMWGVSATKKTQQPEPFIVVPNPSEDKGSTNRSHRSSYTERAPTMLTKITMKQQASLSDRLNSNKPQKADLAAAMDPARVAKRKALEEEGIRWVEKLAKINVGEACYMLANWMDKGLYGFKENKVRSIKLHTVAARSGIPESLYAIALHFDRTSEDLDSARILKYYRMSAERGYVNAIYSLAFIKFKGRLGERQSIKEGLDLMYKACTLCSEEFNEPLYVFAQMLTNEYKEFDLPEPLIAPYGGEEAAILYYERAADLNNSVAQSKLGSIYEHGLYGESMNFAKAFEYYEVAALNNDAKAMLGLSRLNNRGSHGPGDHNEENRLKGDVSGWLASTPINEDLSFSWCEKAANTGLPDALSLLGWFYEIGFGVPRDFEKAAVYYQLAAQKGDNDAKFRLTNTNKSITKQQHDEVTTTQKKKRACFCM